MATSTTALLLRIKIITFGKQVPKIISARKIMKNQNSNRNYIRVSKPPYTYVALTALTIQSSGEKALRLRDIYHRFCILFPSLVNGGKGWRDSIRHVLSGSQYFSFVDKQVTLKRGLN